MDTLPGASISHSTLSAPSARDTPSFSVYTCPPFLLFSVREQSLLSLFKVIPSFCLTHRKRYWTGRVLARTVARIGTVHASRIPAAVQMGLLEICYCSGCEYCPDLLARATFSDSLRAPLQIKEEGRRRCCAKLWATPRFFLSHEPRGYPPTDLRVMA